MELTKFFRTFIEYLFRNWQHKLAALAIAVVIWLFINHSISATKVIPNIPVRVINLPSNKTIVGLMPNGILNKRITLTMTDSKDMIDRLEPGDLEIVLDAATAISDEWVVEVDKRNLVSLNPDVNLTSNLQSISHPEFVIKLSPLATAKIPITINAPVGDAPPGFQFLDIWPQRLMQTLSGPEDEIQKLKTKGFELTFDLSLITKEDLDNFKATQGVYQDEISFPIPAKWKRIAIPYRSQLLEEINDPEAQFLNIDFLKEEPLSIERLLPVRVFFPPKYADTLNPLNYSLLANSKIIEKNGLFFFNQPLEVYHVSRLFLDIVRDNMELTIEAAPKSEREFLQWTLDIVNAHDLENIFVAFMITNSRTTKGTTQQFHKKREDNLRARFRDYTRKMRLYSSAQRKLYLEGQIEGNKIVVH